MACRCQVCGRLYKVDVMIPDDLWEKVVKQSFKPEGAGLICGPCIMEKIEALGEYDAFVLRRIKDFEMFEMYIEVDSLEKHIEKFMNEVIKKRKVD